MRPKLRVLATVLAGSLAALTAFSAGPANAAGTVVDTRTLPVTGAVDDADGTLTDATGNTVATASNIPATFPVTAAQATCTVLDLNLGGVDLNVLGLLVHLDPVHLNISADEGSLIGTLLCLIAGVLGGVAPSTAAVDPLNQLLPLL